MTSTFTIKKEIEHTIDVQVPSFWKHGLYSKVIGILDTDSVFRVYNTESWNSLSVMALDGGIVKEIQEMTPITEEEFFAEYNKAYEALRLKPELRTDDYSTLLNKVVNQTY